MKPLYTGCLAVLLLTACDQPIPAEDAFARQSESYPEAPEFTLRNAAGETIEFPRRTGGADIYFFWATWCPYCKQLMPHLQSILDEYGDRVSVQAINFSENGNPKAYLESQGYTFNLLLQGDYVAAMYGIQGTPGVVIVDGEGRIRFDTTELQDPANRPVEGLGHGQRAQRMAPWWAAQIRMALDRILES